MRTKRSKRMLDILLSLIGIITLSPLFITIALLLLIVHGKPIFYRQNRLGQNGRAFCLWKFRTLPLSYKDPNFSFSEIPSEFTFPSPDLNRLSMVQRRLRESGLDELPQLFNILKGDMSIVGPRPEMEELAICYSNYQMKRLAVKPGLTGLAQIRGRNDVAYRHKIKYDIFYINNQSLSFDYWIVRRTLSTLLNGLRSSSS